MTKLQLSNQKKVKKFLNIALALTSLSFMITYLDIRLIDMVTSLPTFFSFLSQSFFPPSFNQLELHVSAVLDTIVFAIIGTYISAFLALGLGFLMSKEINPFPILSLTIRFIVSFLRNVPLLVWMSLLVFVFGVGNMVGLLALVMATLGFLARSYAESIDSIAASKFEAFKSCGASPFQMLVHGLLPEFIPAWINWTLFAFEINIRASAILGMVGAGGLGMVIQTHLNLRNFQQASGLVVVLVIMVLITEFLVNLLRHFLNISEGS